MNELIISVLQGQATAEQQDELRRWRDASGDNEASFRSMEEFWNQFPPAESTRSILPPTLAELQLRSRASARVRGRSKVPMSAFAATILLLIVATTQVPQLLVRQSAVQPGPAEVMTGTNDMATTILPDGSVVRLAERSRVRAFSEGRNRIVEIDGRAFLSVASDSSRPFIVRTSSGEATVLGTRFEVDARAEAMSVLVVEGAVSVRNAAGGDGVRVKAGERSHHRRDTPPKVEAVEGPERRLAWLGAFAAFESTPLADVFEELGQRLDVRFEISDPAVAARTVTGAFTDDDENTVIDLVCRAAGVRCTSHGDVIHVAP